jgi:enoyl-CoA hydratase/carnithine racemase
VRRCLNTPRTDVFKEYYTRCDIILASPTATFGQPEINLGVIPGAGGTQRLTHAIGKSRAMEIILTGRNFSAKEAETWGLVSRVVGEGEGEVVKEAVGLAVTIASKGGIAVQAAKEAVDAGKQRRNVQIIWDAVAGLNICPPSL